MARNAEAVGENTYGFDAIRGVQAGKEFFVVICPLNIVGKMFHNVEYEISPKERAQRTLNQSRIPVIVKYMLDNPKEYIFSSLTAAVDGNMSFEPAPHLGPDGKIGRLTIDMGARFLLNDGQHRKHAIDEALKERPELRSESISIMFVKDKELKRCQQMFADLNKNAMKPSKSLNILYDQRDEFSQFVVELTETVEAFKNRVNLEKTSIGAGDTDAFTLNGVLDATKKFLGKTKIKEITDEEKQLAEKFWNTLSDILPEWQHLIKKSMKPKEIRDAFVNTNTNCLNALGLVGRVIRETYPDDWAKKLTKLRKIDWSRTNPLWVGNLMQDGKLVRTTVGIEMGADAILKECGIANRVKKRRKK
ncbi:DNA sulfur modification protein DndB [Nitrosopumilaceae archaeon]|nr:DNA sulfur modification protein DndB [Alphaproteobacteria bacterium]CAI9832540.1 DNA sulfur modification protein DndB [Nitrosopumilaceae archaeon]